MYSVAQKAAHGGNGGCVPRGESSLHHRGKEDKEQHVLLSSFPPWCRVSPGPPSPAYPGVLHGNRKRCKGPHYVRTRYTRKTLALTKRTKASAASRITVECVD